MNSTSPHSKRLGSNLMNARESGSTMPRRSGVCSGNQSSHRLSVCVVSPRNDEHCPIAHGLLDRCHSIFASPSRFVVEFNISSFVMYNHPPYILKRLNVPSTHGANGRHPFSVMQAGIFRVLVLYNSLESRTGAMDRFYCPAFTTESSHQIVSFHKPIKSMSCSYLSPATVSRPVHLPCTSQVPIIASFHPHTLLRFLTHFGTYGLLFIQKCFLERK
jgi:hypothetical protein